ncbi:hypothetical protein BpHYR1_009461 [Brachionus plicatilis]|uniref:Uncharacterized protein n=1 Tax=Brachionus plicatilis TaxID=10195 RepID=A0A3M7QE69_BRAPC|nr:hypothetical protein BpHYR1_009461 [Brachionus plicatilis]
MQGQEHECRCFFLPNSLIAFTLFPIIGAWIVILKFMDLPNPILESHDYYFRTETLELQHFLSFSKC